MSNHELMQIFYDGLGAQDRYLLDVASGGTFMSKYEDKVMHLIETVVENSHHNAAKPFGRRAMLKGQMIDAKSVETRMLLARINKNGGSAEYTPRPTQHPQRFRRTLPRLISRGFAIYQLIKIQLN